MSFEILLMERKLVGGGKSVVGSMSVNMNVSIEANDHMFLEKPEREKLGWALLVMCVLAYTLRAWTSLFWFSALTARPHQLLAKVALCMQVDACIAQVWT